MQPGEAAGSSESKKFTLVAFPFAPDYQFLDAFRLCYGNKGLRTMVETNYFIGKLAASICSGRSHTADLMGSYMLEPYTVLDGEVVGAQAIAMPVEDETGYSQAEDFYHLALKDVVVVGNDEPLADNPEEVVLVPIYYPNIPVFYS